MGCPQWAGDVYQSPRAVGSRTARPASALRRWYRSGNRSGSRLALLVFTTPQHRVARWADDDVHAPREVPKGIRPRFWLATARAGALLVGGAERTGWGWVGAISLVHGVLPFQILPAARVGAGVAAERDGHRCQQYSHTAPEWQAQQQVSYESKHSCYFQVLRGGGMLTGSLVCITGAVGQR